MDRKHLIFLFLLGFVKISVEKNCTVYCPREIRIDEDEIERYLREKLEQLKSIIPEGLTEQVSLIFIKLMKATEEVISGLVKTYDFEARDEKTNQTYTCVLVVIKIPFTESENISYYACHLAASNGNQRLLPGGYYFLDLKHSKTFEKLKSFISLAIERSHLYEYLMTVVKYLKAPMQVFEGMTIGTIVHLGINNCHLEAIPADTDCKNKL